MNAQRLLDEARRCGAALLIINGRLKAAPPGLLPAELKTAIRARAAEIKAHLLAEHMTRGRGERPARTRAVTSNSRSPLIPPEVRAKIEAIESEARAQGWPPELLWNAGFWDSPRGLAAVLDAEDEVVEITADAVTFLKCQRHLQRFLRRVT